MPLLIAHSFMKTSPVIKKDIYSIFTQNKALFSSCNFLSPSASGGN
jgi:hypothetical protein